MSASTASEIAALTLVLPLALLAIAQGLPWPMLGASFLFMGIASGRAAVRCRSTRMGLHAMALIFASAVIVLVVSPG